MNRIDPEIGEQIARLIASLPSGYLLQQAKTKDQIEEWHKARKNQLLLAECWKAKYLVTGYYPVEDALSRQEISEPKAELIDRCVNEYKARWELCQVAEKYVKELHTSNLDRIASDASVAHLCWIAVNPKKGVFFLCLTLTPLSLCQSSLAYSLLQPSIWKLL
jgi:hypothetical protein